VRLKPFLWILLIPLVAAPLLAQDSSQRNPLPQTGPSPSMQNPGSPSTTDENEARIQRDMAKKANQERQAQLKRDTDKLLKLATELKEYVDKSNENTLSVNVVKKAEEIEKLARSVKDKMKGE